MGDIVELDVETTLDFAPERVLRSATEAELESVVVIGFDKAGDLYFAASSGETGQVLLLMELARHRLWKEWDGDG